MIHWYINEQQADYVFKCLAQRPFFEVNALINDLHAQANPPTGPSREEVALKEQQQAWANAQEQQKGVLSGANGMAPAANLTPAVWAEGMPPPPP